MKRPIPITFTELLYSVVIGTAITRIESLSADRGNVLLILALVVVFDDYLLYHQKVDTIAYSGRNEVLVFWLDMLVLGSWYCLSLAARGSLRSFWMSAALFFCATSVWEVVFGSGSVWRRVRSADGGLVLTSLALSVAVGLLGGPYLAYVGAFIVLFFFWRWGDWVELWGRQEV